MIDLKEISFELRDIISKKQNEYGLTFTEDTHTYQMLDTKGILRDDWISVSKVIKKFYREFPADEISTKKAKGDPILKQKLLEEWKAAGDYSTNMGSRTHYLLEGKTIDLFGSYKEVRQPVFDCDFEQIMKSDYMVQAGSDYLELMVKRGAILLDTEIVLGHPELGFVGQPDKMWLFTNKTADELGLVCTDWKTNKAKNFEVNHFTDKMYHPFQNQHNNALGHYFVQLPLYCKLLLKMLEGTKYENIKLYGCVVVLLKDDGSYEEFRVPKEVINTVMKMDVKKYLS